MKNVSMLQLILGIGGAFLMYAGIKDLDLKWYITNLISDPRSVFNGSTAYNPGAGPKFPDPTPMPNTPAPAAPKPQVPATPWRPVGWQGA